jgi:predicted nucleotidyltransferase component of viral defense system
MLSAAELAAVAESFGVSDAQVRRDHLISHLLGALSRAGRADVLFFGGTALARTHLSAGRLSEDLDLLALGPRARVAAAIEQVLAGGVRREFGRLIWTPMLTATREAQPALITTDDGLGVRVQLLSPVGRPEWPMEERDLVQRYADAPPARLRVPTLASFVAMKTMAWADRGAVRDLYDLYLLAGVGAINAAARDLYERFGPTGRPPADWLFDASPAKLEWSDQLAAQTRLSVSPTDAAAAVRTAWVRSAGGS